MDLTMAELIKFAKMGEGGGGGGGGVMHEADHAYSRALGDCID